MVSYSPRSAKALSFLKRNYNDIEVFVEDNASPNMWKRMIDRMLPAGTRLKSVNLLGGRSGVVEACKLDQGDDGRRKLYIIDGDFDFAMGRNKPRLKFLHRISSYCVENLLLKNNSIADVAFTNCTNTNIDQLKDRIDSSLGGHEPMIRALFGVYAASEYLKSGVPSVSFGVYRFLSKINGVYELDISKLRARIISFTREVISKVGSLKFSKARKRIFERIKNINIHKIVSGKDFLLPLVWQRIQCFKDFSCKIEVFKVHLAAHLHVSQDHHLRRLLANL
ncbi:DUF4435 domain-containing protein [Agrobacterium vitis]